MQLNTMDCSGRSNNAERDSDLGDDLSHDDHSDDDIRDCDSVDGDHVNRGAPRLNTSASSNGNDMNYGSVGCGGIRSPNHQTEMQMSHHRQFPPNHPLNALGNFMGISGLHGIPNLQHSDVLEKLKMQVRDMKVGLMEQDYAAAHAAAFGTNVLPTPINTAFTLPPTSMASFGHAAAAAQQQNMAAPTSNSVANINANMQNSTNATATGVSTLTNGGGSFSFTSPTAPSTKDVNPASNSSTSSEASNSSQQNNGWSFEEQYKQVRQLYEINDDPKRKEFLDDLFSFMQKRGTPINRLPIMAKSVLDLYELYNLVIARGGLVDVINKKLWQEIIKGLHLPSSITSAAFTLRTQYMKYLYPYECEKKNLSTPAELQAAIDGNRREGRRSSYGQYEAMHNQMQMPQMARQSMPGGMQQMSPLALVTHAAAANNQQAQAAAAAAAAHHRLMAPNFGQVPNLVTHEIEQRMMEYLKLIQAKKEQNASAVGGGVGNANAMVGVLAPSHQQQQQQQQQRQRSQSPDITTREALNALEMSRVALWQMYHNNTSPPASVNTSPQGGGVNGVEPQRSEALNLSDSPPNLTTIKREREREPSPEPCDRDDFHHQPPAAKRGNIMPPGFPASFYLPHGMAAAAAAANFHHQHHNATHESDVEDEEEHEHEHDDEDIGGGDVGGGGCNMHNTTANSSSDDHNDERQLLNGHHSNEHLHHHDKSDDSAIENSPSTSAGNGHSSPVSTKKIHLSKQQITQHNCGDAVATTSNATSTTSASIGALETLSLLSGMQFRVARNGTGANGEQQLVVNLELNGIKYSGVLIANAIAGATLPSAKHHHSNNNNNKKNDDKNEVMDIEAKEDIAATIDNAPDALVKLSGGASGITNGASSVTSLKDGLITT